MLTTTTTRTMTTSASDTSGVSQGIERFEQEQMFEEDVRAVMQMLRPNRNERLLGWNEYRTGGAHFRATISWDEDFERTAREKQDAFLRSAAPDVAPAGTPLAAPQPGEDPRLMIPNLAEVLETILVGAIKHDDDLSADEEFEIYRGVVRDLYKRLIDMESCYD